ncbi:hypothetical protein QAD02_010396 [Eretmocerus hayati]|uniref:Uncharacterized protein n=1 Tax=Eretmocerus hayati TaxID=131215 RepID=A0ACC2ND78_9HYME|nr:hypothetical protein QAD02_010396 [Eretmocerus hayati]
MNILRHPEGHNVNVWSWLGSRRGGGAPGCGVSTPLSLPQHRRNLNPLPAENHYTHMQTDEALYAELDSQAASYASGSDDKHYHELDALGLHRQHLQQDTLCSRHSQRLEEPDYELYENGPSLASLHRHHPLQHHRHELSGQPPDGGGQQQPSYQNTGYTGSDVEPDGPSTMSSAPSSAYYSDLSSSSALLQQQQQLGPLGPGPESEGPPIYESACQYRLSAINEAGSPTCALDYI